jgi:16S rRNA (guanine527-N7)-methyltransferase
MKSSELEDTLISGMSKLNLKFTKEQVDLLFNYWDIVVETNKVMNLTRISYEDTITHNFLDTAAIIPIIKQSVNDLTKLNLLDIGSGCGVPGIVLKILLPEINLVMVDSLLKRVKFLNDTLHKLKLDKDATAIHTRVEDLKGNKLYKNKFEIITARAVTSLDNLISYSFPLKAKGGVCLFMKGPKVLDEVKQTKFPVQLIELDVPYLDEKRFVVQI